MMLARKDPAGTPIGLAAKRSLQEDVVTGVKTISSSHGPAITSSFRRRYWRGIGSSRHLRPVSASHLPLLEMRPGASVLRLVVQPGGPPGVRSGRRPSVSAER